MSEPRHTKEDLYMMQALPLDLKIRLTEDRIKAWVNEYGEDGVCVSFSGGKDSTVLLHIVRSLYPDVRAVFSNTGLEYPEIRQFAMSHDNVDIVYPEMRFKDVITQYGYPLISKEVAEAIYYARRIGGGGTHKETTTQTPWTPTRPNAENATKSMGGGVEELPQKMSPTESKRPTRRTVLLGQMGGGCYETNFKETHRKRCDLKGKWQRSMVQLSQGMEKETRTQGIQNRDDGDPF